MPTSNCSKERSPISSRRRLGLLVCVALVCGGAGHAGAAQGARVENFRKSARLSARLPGGGEEDIISVPNLDFHTRTVYCLSRPRRLPAGTTLVLKGVFDNSARNRSNPDPGLWVRSGIKETDEYLEAMLYYTR